ncbi:hypothetical protein [Vibrio phage VP4B]|uniref:Uncharacterized protein n=1 Tax=Vibrio phage VP4B TaxID=1262540 RepID=V9LZD9_9CAUD|nr:hypothetical protein FDJ61_gp103 [Vibrio phage VP4B]AGB07217.1 hypothetical protein [Vibrio phage VP4B]
MQPSNENQPPKIRDKHTSENTTMKNSVSPKLPTKYELAKGESDPVLNFMLGTTKAEFEPMMRLVLSWSRYKAAVHEGEAPKAEIARLRGNYEQLRDDMFPNMPEEELETKMGHFLSFHRNYVELAYFRNTDLLNRPWENESEFADGKFEHDVVKRYPGAKNAATSISESMKRASQRKSRTPNGYDVLLRDSFIQIRLEPSDLLELGAVADRINKEIHGYVQTINGNSLTLIRASIYRVFWEYLCEKISQHSVTDVDEPRDLARLIKLSDLRVLFTELLGEVMANGIPMTVHCNQSGCDWVDVLKADPYTMLWHDKSMLTSEQAAALGNLKNFAERYSSEEVLALQSQYQFVEETHIMFSDDTQRIDFEQPTISEYFLAFDVFMEYIGPSIREIRSETLDDKDFESKLSNLVDTVRGLEYLHWCSKLTVYPDEGSDEEPQVFLRSDNPIEFFNGLIGVIDPDDDVTSKVIRWCVAHGPEMSCSVVGMSNATCPKCGKETHGGHTAHGITPIDPFMSFFVLTRQAIAERAVTRAIIAPNTL